MAKKGRLGSLTSPKHSSAPKSGRPSASGQRSGQPVAKITKGGSISNSRLKNLGPVRRTAHTNSLRIPPG